MYILEYVRSNRIWPEDQNTKPQIQVTNPGMRNPLLIKELGAKIATYFPLFMYNSIMLSIHSATIYTIVTLIFFLFTYCDLKFLPNYSIILEVFSN